MFKTDLLRNVKENILNNRDKYIQYKNSSYYSMLNECGKTVKTEAEINQIINQLPQIQQMDASIEENKYHIETLNARLKGLMREHRERIKSFRLMNPPPEYGEDKVLKMFISEEKKMKKRVSSEVKTALNKYKSEIKKSKKNRNLLVKKLNQTTKKLLREEIKIEKDIENAEKKTRKAAQKQFNDIEDFNNKELIELNEKYMKIAEREINDKMYKLENKNTRKNKRSSQ